MPIVAVANLLIGCGQGRIAAAGPAPVDSIAVVRRARALLDKPDDYVVGSYVRKSHGVLVTFDYRMRQDSAGIHICGDCEKDICVPDSGAAILFSQGMMSAVSPPACQDSTAHPGAL